MSFLSKRAPWSAAAIAVVAIAAGGVTAAGANSQKASETSFNLFPNNAVLNCLAEPGHTPHADLKVERGKLNDRLTLEVKNLKPNLDFDVFTVENSPQVSDGTANPAFNKNFGFAWYQSDLHTNRHGEGEIHLRTILLDQIFGFDAGRAVPPVNTFNLGFWFNNPADVANCGFTGVTPFNGEHNAGPLAMISRIDVTTKLGPLCTDPESNADGTFRCNP
ncbi:MAG: hypothetical protein QOD72_2890 [Acidimicrobiaceae bacterium]|jgi:hypothetical protein|nr:hypothetical protein [Acidimicrobiaceae bacterium]